MKRVVPLALLACLFIGGCGAPAPQPPAINPPPPANQPPPPERPPGGAGGMNGSM